MGNYAIKEIFLTLHGEGSHVGRAAVFCRFAGCNLWSGCEVDRSHAVCQFCDTDFVGTDGTKGGRYRTALDLAGAIEAEWAGGQQNRFCVLTGGEPLLQVDEDLIRMLHDGGFRIAVETNGTLRAPRGIDWICVSPKSGSELVITAGDELKLVYPQERASPESFDHLAFDHFLLQPMDGPDLAANTQRAIRYCIEHPRWRLSVQTHKYLGIR